jgi:hypothetical protein
MSRLYATRSCWAGRRIIYLSEVRRQTSGDWLLQRYELTGPNARRIAALELPANQSASLSNPERLSLSIKAPDLKANAAADGGDWPSSSSGAVLSELFPLDQANEALSRLRTGRLRGAAVLVP